MSGILSDLSTLQLTLVGTNHIYAPIALRERLWFQPESLPNYLGSMIHETKGVSEVVILSTCNRTEVYVVSQRNPNIAEYLTSKISDWSGIQTAELAGHMYLLTDEEAVEHLFTVSSGLDSLVLGDGQVQGQVKDAAKTASQAGTIGRFLFELFQQAARAAADIRKQSGLEHEKNSVSSAAVSLIKQKMGNNPIKSILLIGAGKMIAIATERLTQAGGIEVFVANRTIERAEALAERIGGKPLALNQISEALANTDAVLSCIGVTRYVVDAGDLESAMRKRNNRPLLLVDAGVPRNIDPAAAQIPQVQLYNIDDLAPFLKDNHDTMQANIAQARALVRKEADKFNAHIKTYEAIGTLKDLRKVAEEIREAELSKALRRLGDLSDHDKKVVDLLTKRIINKLLFEPTARLKEHASNGDGDTYEAIIRELFAIDKGGQL